MESCPICNIDLGCVPLEKLRLDHNLQDVRAKIFPCKRIKVKAPEIMSPVMLPAKRKERSLSSLVVSTPRVSSSAQIGMTGRRSKSTARKASRGSSFTIERPPVIRRDEDSMDEQPESSSSPDTLKRFTQNMRQNSSAGETSDKRRENQSEAWEGKVDLWKPLNCLVEAANRTKSSKLSVQGPGGKSEPSHARDNEGLLGKSKNREQRQKSKVQEEKSCSDHTPVEPERPKKMRRVRQKKAQNFGDFKVPPQAVLDGAKSERKNYPVWFSLVSDKQ
ncbi:E3 ubiquitin protein ligase drip1 [Phtheirospermum japonicum]|uniref:E3 ubiquitin protein ligase drip1 n=1 Tax=Phtheirospermum japonicum TaxID=374723 RepID=A0A830CIE2_9LAMI|nr:E3 ubiquitin protein ligase drip1 [Phtheirospermum japonicum]